MVHWLAEVLLRQGHLAGEARWQRVLVRRHGHAVQLHRAVRLLADLELGAAVVASSPSVHTSVPPVLDGVVAATT